MLSNLLEERGILTDRLNTRIRSRGEGDTQKNGHRPKYGNGNKGTALRKSSGKHCGVSHSWRTKIITRTQDRDGIDTEHKEDIY